MAPARARAPSKFLSPSYPIFGAISYCDEHPLHHFHKRIRARLAFGEPAHHQEIVARSLGLAE